MWTTNGVLLLVVMILGDSEFHDRAHVARAYLLSSSNNENVATLLGKSNSYGSTNA
jgi:hypothetical protein